VKVTKKDGCLRACDHQNHKDEEKKTKHVVHLTGPNRIEDEKELDENAAKRQDSAHDHSRNRLSVDGLLGNLARDLVCPDRMLQGLKIYN